MLRFAQHDIDEVGHIVTQPLKGEDVKLQSLSKIIPADRLLKSRMGVDIIRAKEICTNGRADTLR
jgi:hypothetical protein